ncbi:InlB B-repeat-containing protein [[Ruminococcus] lactaris]|uniref:InlB B-repeat-containing protein n=1 Tax=[Ruminococcus] lactaris TaxID=46228 RepID=UPI003520FA2F
MKKRILSILLLCCMVLTMVLTMLPTTAFAAGELPDVKLSVPTTFDKTVDLTKQNKELKIKDSKTYLIKGSADPNWYFQYRIKIDGKNNTPHIFLDGVRLQAPKDGPAIELYGGASACLYFIGGDSELIGTENFAALQKNKTDGYLRVLVRTGTKLTCKGGTYGAGIGGSKVGIKKFSQGHGVNLHFGSLATDIYSGEISATSGPFAAGIGGGANGGVGEQIYVYSGKLTATSVSQGAGIGGGQGGPGRFIYIRGGTVVSSSRSAGAGIGSGDQDGLNEREDAHHIEISGGAVLAFSNYAGAGIGGGRDGSGCDISITGGVVQAQGYFGAGIGGGMNGDSWNILIKDTTLTALAFPLYPSSDYTELSASAVGRGSNRTHYMSAMKNQEDLLYEENIKIGASDGKSVRLSATGWQWHRSQGPYEMDWGTTTELLIPNENGCVDLQRLSLPYAYNYGRVISKLELRCVESTCSHEFGWANRDGCHIWACKNCGARDPAAEMSKQNGKHIPGDWSNQEQFCTVCGHVLERDTKAPVMETLTDGESYTVEDTLDGKPGAYTFTVSDPAASGETSSGVKSVTINGVPQDGPTYRLPAPDGGNNDAGAEYTVVATDNAGNETTATVRTYRRHHEHSYSDWSKDGTSHWHECTDYDCPNRNKSIKDKAAHDYTDDADTICNVCGYERTVTPPAPAEYTITVTSGGNGTASTSHAKAVAGTEITLTATPNTGYHFKEWEVMSGGVTIKDDKFLMPGSNVEVKAIFEDMSKEQFTLAPGGTYYFDLSGESIPGTANDALPDSTMHYVPFTYAGTVDAYKLTSEMATTEEYAQQNEYAHSLFMADYAVTHAVSWDKLHAEGLIFGKGYAAGSVEYTMRAPSGGSAATSNYSLGTPQSNEWDRILDKNGGYIKNWGKMESWGQDTSPYTLSNRVVRGYHSPRKFADANTTLDFPYFGFRPVLEVLNPDTLGTDGLKAVTLDLGGGKLGGSPDTIQIIVKTGESFTAPASDGLTRPDGNTGSYFKWLGSDGNLYAPGDNVPAVVTRLTAQFDSSSHSVTITFNGNGGTGTMDSVTVKAGANYTLPACGFTEPEGKQFKGWSTSADGSVISGTTYEVSSDTTFYAIWESKEYSIIVTDGKATIGAGSEISKAAQGTTITLTANAAPDGKVFDKWVVESGSATLEDANSETTTFIMPDSEVSVKATYKNAPVTTYSLTTQVNGGHGTISASKTGLTEGSTETVTFTPDDGYEIDLVTVNGVVTDVLSNILNVTMDADKTVIVTYKAIPHTHTYDQEIQKPETLKSAADCTNDAVYFKSCSCGEISTTETFTAAGTQLGHAWASDWSKDTDNHWKECSRCHEKKDEAAHDYGSDNICDTCGYDKTVPHTHNLTLVPAKTPTCTEKGNTAYYTCDGCDKWFEDATGASEITDKTSVILAATGHSVSDWKSDHTDHWKECTVVGCGVIIEDSKAAHTAGEWIIDTPATATTSGSKHKECTVCGYTMAAETIPATGGGEHTHSYGSDWKYDADNHWHECSCGDKADKAAHDFKWVVDKEATATQKGSKHEECKVCGYKKAAVEILATGSTTKPTDPTQTNSNTGAEGPKTGDNSNMILWIALLFISGGAVIGITVYSKKKKENAE